MRIFHVLNVDTDINIEKLIIDFNRIQPSFRLAKLEESVNFAVSNNVLKRETFFEYFRGRIKEEIRFIIGITQKPLENNWFSDVDETYQVAIISIDQSELYSPPFKIEDYLKSDILLSILLMLTQMNIGHYATLGCLFDVCANKKDIVVKLHSGSICAECKARLMYYGITEEELASAQKILWNISRDFISIRVSKGCPIGHRVCKEFHEI